MVTWEEITEGCETDAEKVEAALKFFKQGGCCGGNCDCSNRKPQQEPSKGGGYK